MPFVNMCPFGGDESPNWKSIKLMRDLILTRTPLLMFISNSTCPTYCGRKPTYKTPEKNSRRTEPFHSSHWLSVTINLWTGAQRLLMQDTPELFVTNFNPRFTGVSATTAAVFPEQRRALKAVLVDRPLPGCPEPMTKAQALALSRRAPPGKPFAIWHVRRNTEMRLALIARDLLRLPIRIVFTSAAQRQHSAFPRWLIGRMDAVIATTKVAADFIPGCRAVVPHGVDTERFRPAKDRAAAWRATGFPGDYGILTVGRIRPEKGTDLFVKAMIRALPQLPGAVAVVAGIAKSADQAFLASLKAQVAAVGPNAYPACCRDRAC